MHLKLLVIRTSSPDQLAQFYTYLGLEFEYHQHGSGPFHYACTIDGMVLEIYPLAKGQPATDPYLRLGFAVDDFETLIYKLEQLNVKFISTPAQTDFGWMCVVQDPDGRKIEMYKK
ncbi:VOC family protein [Haliscomenobacter hydrossis]|uniref:Glyoxalase/bleomycin resistance protein/dioxygenase n=1 Tax=Haliscomenobacter hydrossis (strain ATCC 27775 / DSM 1100 / LMG 10767 / O) TaxID=760192 RepID=F4L4F3_HALH1|nr:glyoxalase/bleomycin resistance/extradiol dioxygenase family protein [Haliscomenobacter hydrossis]AEE51822.1 Glyoxalase/bleomycin resistance protein/dioxygenase [Haliscomenobacter hydrossis DSM 1100]